MKGKLITNGILSIVWFIGFIMMMVAVANVKNEVVQTPYGIAIVKTASLSDAWYWLAGLSIFIISGIASFVMGIVTLASKNKSGLAVASGVIAILSGLFGVNSIVSFIGASKEI